MKPVSTHATLDAIVRLDDLRAWIERELDAPAHQKRQLESYVTTVLERQRRRLRESAVKGARALEAAFADKLADARHEVERRDTAVAAITHYFEEVVSELSDRARRDPKTHLLNGTSFVERVETFLAGEPRALWSAVGIIDVRHFKRINDNLGHAVGDLVIAGVAKILSEQLRSRETQETNEFLTSSGPRDLHARLGGDEFGFFVPALLRPEDARTIAVRFKTKLETFPWQTQEPGLRNFPVKVDIGVVCVRLGTLDQRLGAARPVAAELLMRADRLMYAAKRGRLETVALGLATIQDGHLVDVNPSEPASPESCAPRASEPQPTLTRALGPGSA